jgi:hypothetical protein
MKKRFGFFGKNFQTGTTLLEAMIAIGILGIVGVGMTQFFFSSIKMDKKNKIKAVMTFLAGDIENKLKSPSTIYLSLLDNANANLIQCVLGTLTGCTNSLVTYNANNPNYFALNYATGVSSAARMTSASANNPTYYDKDGLITTIRAKRVFVAKTFFYATCDPVDGTTCLRGPASVQVAYVVSQIPGTLPEFGTGIFRDIPRAVHFFSHQVKDILGTFNTSTCNPGAVISGYDRRGYATCRCSSPYIQGTFPNNRFGPICRLLLAAEVYCPNPNTVFRGLTTDGRANCLPASAAYDCISGTPLNLVGARCPAGYWVQEDIRPNCKYYCTIPKADGGQALWCNSDERAEDRDSQGYRNFPSQRIQPPQYTLDGNDHRQPSQPKYQIGMVCPTRTLTCCRAK